MHWIRCAEEQSGLPSGAVMDVLASSQVLADSHILDSLHVASLRSSS